MTIADKLIYIPNDDTQNYPFCRLKFVVETFEHSIKITNQSNFTKVPKVFKPTNKKTLLYDFEDLYNKQLTVPLSLCENSMQAADWMRG